MAVVSRFKAIATVFGCGVTVLQNMVRYLQFYVTGSPEVATNYNCHTIAVAEKINYNEKF